MATEVMVLNSPGELRTHAREWDDLWLHSDVSDPTARAELLAQWLDFFAPDCRFMALVLREGDTFLAALPLVEQKVWRWKKVGHVPTNGWAFGAGLLVHQEITEAPSLAPLIHGFRKLPWDLVWLECVRYQSAAYRLFKDALATQRVPYSTRDQYSVGYLSTTGTWEQFWKELSSTSRDNLRKREKRLHALGHVEFRACHHNSAAHESPLQTSFQLEHATWKGAQGSSIIARGVEPYFQKQAQTLSEWHALRHYQLLLNGSPIAFQYGFVAKGVFHDCKTSFLPEYSQVSPGHLLYQFILQECFSDSTIQSRDNMGILPQTPGLWPYMEKAVGQFLFSTRGIVAPFAIHVHRCYWPLLRDWLKSPGHRDSAGALASPS